MFFFKALSSWMDRELHEARKQRSLEALNRATFAIADAHSAISECRGENCEIPRGRRNGK